MFSSKIHITWKHHKKYEIKSKAHIKKKISMVWGMGEN